MNLRRPFPRLPWTPGAVLWPSILVGLVGFAAAASAPAQPLFTVVDDPSVATRVQQASRALQASVPAVSELVVEADFELLRSGAERLELLAPDGNTLTAFRTAFEVRGTGNLLWTGRIENVEHTGVVLTLHDGYLVGSYAGPGGANINVSVSPDGVGRVFRLADASEDEREMCRVLRPPPRSGPGQAESADPRAAQQMAAAKDLRRRQQQQEQESVQLDVLVLYTQAAADLLNSGSTVAAQVAHFVDYTNTALNNSAVGGSVSLDGLLTLPGSVSQGTSIRQGFEVTNVFLELHDNVDVARLRSERDADIVLALHHETRSDNFCGLAWQWIKESDTKMPYTNQRMSQLAYAEVDVGCGSGNRPLASLFAHEIGHNLGGSHDRANEPAPDLALYPYAFGFNNGSAGIYTIMSYSSNSSQVRVPYFSSVARTYNGSAIGVLNREENERVLKQTLPEAVTFSNYLPPPPPELNTVKPTLAGSRLGVVLTWTDPSGRETGYAVQVRQPGSQDSRWEEAALVAEDSTSATLTGLLTATAYRFRVVNHWSGRADFEFPSNEVDFTTPSAPPNTPEPGAPAPLPSPPGDVTVTSLTQTSVMVSWSDLSSDETSFEVQQRTGARWTTVATTSMNVESATVANVSLDTLHYFRVIARNAQGAAISQAAPWQSPPTPPSGLTTTARGSTAAKLTWAPGSSSALGFDLERRLGTGAWTTFARVGAEVTAWPVYGLEEGSAYDLRVLAWNEGGPSAPSGTVSLGRPPAAPSDLLLDYSGGSVNLTWTDNSSDETSFDILWLREDESSLGWDLEHNFPVGTAAADTTSWSMSVADDLGSFWTVVARNANGYSDRSNVVVHAEPPRPKAPQLNVDVLDSTSVRLVWEDTSSGEGGFAVATAQWGASFDYEDQTDRPDLWTNRSYVDENEEMLTVAGLNASEAYAFTVGSFLGPVDDVDDRLIAFDFPVILRMPPAGPSDLLVVPSSDTSVELSWTDNATDEASYLVQHSDGSSWTDLSATSGATTATVTGLTSGRGYEFRALALNPNGRSTPSNVVTTGPPLSPPAPSGLTVVTSGSTSVELSWTDGSTNEDAFDVEHRTSGAGWTVSTSLVPDSTEARVTGLGASTIYDFRVTARNANGSNASGVVTLTMPPAAPGGLAVTSVAETTATLSWTDNSSDETGFLLEYKLAGARDWTAFGTETAADATSGQLTGLMTKASYEARVRARHSQNGLSSPSNAVSFKTGGPPAAPSGLAAGSPGSTSVSLSWTDNSDDETGFRVEWREVGAANWTSGATTAADETSATASSLARRTSYEFRVLAFNLSGDSEPSNVVRAATQGPPAAATNVAATATGSSSVSVSWTDNSSDETGFVVQYRTAGAGSWTASSTASANSTSTNVTGLSPSTAYEFRVVARNQHGDAPSSAATLTMPPAAPSGARATALSSASARVDWTDNSSDESGFEVEYKASGTQTWTTFGTAAAADATSLTITGLTANTQYQFRVRARHQANGLSSASNVVSVTLPGPPTAPRSLTAEQWGSTTAWLEWDDRSSDESWFDVELRRATGAAGAWVTAASPGPGEEGWALAGLSPSTAYQFRVRATNVAGRSQPSNVVSLTTSPARPTNAVATYNSDTENLTVTWTDNASNETGYVLEYLDDEEDDDRNDSSNWTELGSYPANTTTATVTDEEFPYTYICRVIAQHNQNGNSTPSNPCAFAGDDSLRYPTQPSFLQVTKQGSSSVVVTWGAEGAHATSQTLLWRRLQDQQNSFLELGAGVTSHTLTNLQPSTTYLFDLALDNDNGRVYVMQPGSDTISGIEHFPLQTRMPPAKPTSLTASAAGSTDVGLSWSDASRDETGFLVEYRSKIAASAWTGASTAGMNADEATVTGLMAATAYEFRVTAVNANGKSTPSDVASATTEQGVATMLTVTGLVSGTVAENAAYTSATPTVTGHRGAVTWTKSGTDAADFTIDSSTGVLSMIARDHEDPQDADTDNAYEVTVTATDEDSITGSVSITVTVTNVNEAPTFAASATLALSVAEGTTGNIGSPVTATDPEGAAITYTLTGTDAAAFQISTTGQLSLAAGTVLNYEQKSSYSLSVVASDGQTPPLTATRAVTITVTDVGESLTVTGLTNGTVAENAAYTSATPTVTGHRGAVTWSKSGNDAADFTIDSGTGVLSMIARDHEDPQDADTDNAYEVTVTATDEDSITGSVSITVTVTNVNEAPTFAASATLALSVAEGTTGNIGSPVTATDPEGAAITYTLTGTDAAAFQISTTGQLSLAAGTVLNYEQKSSYSLSVVASDGQTPPLTATRAVTITVTDVGESLTVTGLTNGTVAENAAYTSATPTVTGHRGAVTWSKSGNDAADFTIDSGTGVLSMIARDHEDPQDADTDNVYEVTVTATDEDSITGSASITVTVTNVNEAPTFAASATLALSVAEGTTGNIGSPVTATDSEGAAITYTLTGTDAAAFQISTTGQLSLAAGTVLNYEQKSSYSLSVVASDGQTPPLTATRAVTIAVTDVGESLTVTGLTNGTVAENAAYTSATPTVTGHRGTVTWSKSGSDAADFAIDSGTGVLSMIARDHEDPQDADTDNVYEVTVTATDEDSITGSASITVTVTNVNEAPTFAASATLALSVAEGTTGNIGSPVTATDPEGAAITYTLTGTDVAAFQISTTGQISLAAGTVLNYEQKSSYTLNVVASDGQTPPLTATRAVTLTVTDVGESLTVTGLVSGTVAENAAYTSATPTVTGHRGTVTWTKSGSDAADFTIDSSTGVLSMISRDHEDPQDADTDNVYEVTVTATDEDSITGSASITVTVTNVNEAPTFAASATLALSVAEGTTGNIGSPVTATDPEGAAITYTLTGTDVAAFEISTTGQISLAAGTVLNYEQKSSYTLSVVASDGQTPPLTATRAVTLTVTDLGESLTVTGLTNGTVAENAAYTSATPAVTGHRGAVTWSKSGSDAADFTIDSSTGVLSMIARDHEDPQDADTDNVYEVTVTATDEDSITGSASITVTVTNVNEAPTFAASATLALSVAEGTTGNIGSPVTATDSEGAAITYTLTGTDAAAFQISTTGQLSLAAGTVLNYEQKSSYSLSVVASDGQTPPLTATRAVTIAVTDVGESLTVTGLTNGTVAENAAYTSATPTVTGHRGAVTWTKSGSDAADFTIDSGTGVLSMVGRDHEDPQDADTDNVYEVTVTATDEDSITGSVSITVTVTDVDKITETPGPGGPEEPPEPTTPPPPANGAPEYPSSAPLAFLVAEGTSGAIGSPVAAVDPDGDELTYSLAGSDAAFFSIDPTTGQIFTQAATPLLRREPESYGFTVVASDGALSASRYVVVTVTERETGAPDGPPPTEAPAAPANLTATLLTADSVLLTWEDEASDEAGFLILQRANDGEWEALRSVPADTRSATIEGLDQATRYEFLVVSASAAGSSASDMAGVTLTLAPPTHLDGKILAPDAVRLTWRDNAVAETGFDVDYRLATDEEWSDGPRLGANRTSTSLTGLTEGSRYDFRVAARGPDRVAYSRVGAFVLREPPAPGDSTDCTPTDVVAVMQGNYEIRMCFETPSGTSTDASNYHLESDTSGLLYFFDRDNVEVLVKVLDGCAINGHRWVFIAPVTDLAFNLTITERSTGRSFEHRNPKSRTARTRSDTAAFPCRREASASLAPSGAAAGRVHDAALVGATPPTGASARPDAGTGAGSAKPGAAPDAPPSTCKPTGPGIQLDGGYRLDMCFATPGGLVQSALDWGLYGNSSALLYFFDRSNAEVLVKLLDGCAINGHRWVFSAPATDLEFNLTITAPDGERWVHRNTGGRTATPRADTAAFACR